MTEFDPLTGELLPEGNANPPAAQAQEAPDIAKLEGMTREDLIALVGRMARQCGMVASMTKDETAQAMLDRLASDALRSTTPIKDCITAINSWLDREQGKATQRIEMKAQVATFDVVAHREQVTRQTEEMFNRLAGVTIGSGNV